MVLRKAGIFIRTPIYDIRFTLQPIVLGLGRPGPPGQTVQGHVGAETVRGQGHAKVETGVQVGISKLRTAGTQLARVSWTKRACSQLIERVACLLTGSL